MSQSTTDSEADWQSAPERDFLAFRLISLAELYLDSHFADPAGTEDYQRPSRRTSSRGKGPRALASWKRDGVTLTLFPRPDDAECFQVDLSSDQFSAVLRLRYLPEDMELRAARVEQFSGDIRAGITVATEWLNDQSDLPEETMLKAALEELADLPPASAAGTEAAEKETPSDPSASEPPPHTAAVTRDVKTLVRTVAAEIRRNGAPSLEAASQGWMEDHPQSLWPLFDAAVAAGTARRRDEALIGACRWLLANQQWTPAPPLAIQSSVIDGSGGQSLILTTPKGQTGLFAGLLLKQSFGIRDAWCNPSLARREIDEAFGESRRQTPTAMTGRDYLDVMVQHHIARGLTMGTLPHAAVIEIAERIGAADWKDRGLDVTAEIERRFAGLAVERRSPDAIAASLQRSGAWVAKNPMVESWFEDDAAIRPLAGGIARLNPQVGVQRLLEEILPARRESWAERLLLTTLWLQASSGDASPADGGRWQDCAVLAHELLAGRKLAELPAMVAIAERSIAVARANRW